MSYYVCSDIHGRFDRYKKLLDTIQLSSDDTLYVLGDAIDRNPDGISILLDIMARDGVELFLGNHEWFLYNSIFASGDSFSEDWYMKRIWCSPNNGGAFTARAFYALDDGTKRQVLAAIRDSTLLRVLEVNGVKYHLSHSFTLPHLESDYYSFQDVSPKDAEEVVWKSAFRRDEYSASYGEFDESLLFIVGHVPVQRVSGNAQIFRHANIIDIDCGCAYAFLENNSLACLRLDDMQEFYIT